VLTFCVLGIANHPTARGDELLSLTPSDLTCYNFCMYNRQDAPRSPLRTTRLFAAKKTSFDGTNLPVVERHFQTTTYGRNRPLGSTLMDEIRTGNPHARHRITLLKRQSSAPRATLRFSLSHWVQGSPLPPAAQAINFHRDSPLE
jgi:hypothetical protein